MPSDIRNFFGGAPDGDAVAKSPSKSDDPSMTRRKRSRKVIDDSDDEDISEVKPSKAKPARQPEPAESKGEQTTSSDYFAAHKKRGRRPKTSDTLADISKSVDNSRPKPEDNALFELRKGAEVEQQKRYAHTRSKKPTLVIGKESPGGEDIFAAEYQRLGRGDDEYVEDEDGGKSESDFEQLTAKGTSGAPIKSARSKRSSVANFGDGPAIADTAVRSKAAKSDGLHPGRKRKSEVFLEDGEGGKPDEHLEQSSTVPALSKRRKALPTRQDRPESKEIQDIFDSIPMVRAPSPPAKSSEPAKFNYAAQAQRSRDPPAGGSTELPMGAENCLAGLSFVFTGVLESIGREEGQALVKRYGGKVTGAPSSKTSYVVLGSDAGPKKLQTIQQHKLKTINEGGLFELIRRLPANGGDGKAAEKYEAKKKVEEMKVRSMAAEIDRDEEQKRRAQATTSVGTYPPQTSSKPQVTQVEDRLWTSKYAPTSMNMLCGNKSAVEKLQTWLRNWRKNAKSGFHKPGKDGSGIYRAVMIHGPPGIGKTTAAHLISNLEGYDVLETNASDTRSKKLVETNLLGVLDTTSLQGYFSGIGKKVEREKKNMVLIMDEVDGMSAGDRGGVGALASIAKRTEIPLILICNDRRLPKMKPFDHVVFELPFRRPTAEQIRARLSTICFREGLKIPPAVLDGLIEGTHADIRQVINMLSTVKLGQKHLEFDQGREMSKAWEKHVILKPWDIVGKILSSQMFSPSSTSTLNDKIELYFNDHEFSYLMLQENYLRTRPVLGGGYQGKEQSLKLLELTDNAASSISDGDLVDKMIHGTQQQWSLMPTHAVFSFVRPASFICGNMMERPGFTSWLGQNSKQGKLSRYVKEIQGHLRLRATGDRDEIRQQYMPLLWDKIVRRLMTNGKDSVDDVIDFMDSYFLTREDWDAIVELGLGPMDESNVKLETQTKAAFTRIYNQRAHPLPFMRTNESALPKKMLKEKPDIDDAIADSDEEDIIEDAKTGEDDEELDLKKDKYISLTKKPAARRGNAGKNKKGKKASGTEDLSDEEKSKKNRNRKSKAKS